MNLASRNSITKFIKEEAREIEVLAECDVIVAGGGVAGIGAATAAARNGASVILIDSHGYLGGTATAGMVNNFGGYKLSLISGILKEFIGRLESYKSIISIYNEVLNGYTSYYDVEMFKYVSLQMLEEAGVKLLLHSYIVNSIVKNNKINGVILESKSGRKAVLSKNTIDSSGDGDVAALAGAEYEKGRESDGKTQAMTLCFRMGNVNLQVLIDYINKNKEEFRELNIDLSNNPPILAIGGFKSIINKARKNKDLSIDHEILWIGSLIREGEVWINWTHIVDVDGLNVLDLTYAEIEGMKQVIECVNFLKKYIAGFKSSYLVNIANDIGIRETRRIMGEYVLTEDDILSGKRFSDAIARNNSPMDIHSPSDEKQDWIDAKHYDIPYSCLVPRNIDNLLVAGRCISSTHKAMASIRFEPCCMATGQAAGTAAAIAVKDSVVPRKINITKLQRILKSQGVII